MGFFSSSPPPLSPFPSYFLSLDHPHILVIFFTNSSSSTLYFSPLVLCTGRCGGYGGCAHINGLDISSPPTRPVLSLENLLPKNLAEGLQSASDACSCLVLNRLEFPPIFVEYRLPLGSTGIGKKLTRSRLVGSRLRLSELT